MSKILHINSNYVDKFYAELYESISEKGFDNEVFVPQKIGFDDCPNAKGVIKSHCYSKLDRFFLRRKARKIFSSIEKNIDISKVDIIHAHSLYTAGVPAYYCWLKYKIPYIVSVRYNDVKNFPKFNPFSKSLISAVLKNAGAIIFITPLIEKTARKVFKVLNNDEIKAKCHIIPNKISSFFFNGSKPKKYINKDKLEVLFVGTMLKRKRLKLLCKLCKAFFKEGDKLSVISTSNYVPTRLINKYKFINYIGKVPHNELPSYYEKADIFALLSKNETFGISYIESMSQGTPVLFTKNEAIDGLFKEGEVGYGVNTKSSKDFCIKVKSVLDNYEVISKKCITEAKRFSDFEIVNKLVGIYNNII